MGRRKASPPQYENGADVPPMSQLDREREALVLRQEGKTYAAIAEHLHYRDGSGAKKAVDRALARTVQEPADELRTLMVSRLERLNEAVWSKAIGGDLAAVDRALRIAAQLAQLLNLNVTPVGGGRTVGDLDASIEVLLGELAGGMPAGPGHPG